MRTKGRLFAKKIIILFVETTMKASDAYLGKFGNKRKRN